MTNSRIGRALYQARRFVQFFLLVGFVVSCCMLLFLSSLQQAMGLTFTESNIQQAAKLTMINVVVLTSLLMLLDSLWRRRMVEQPARQIMQAAEKLMQGDFTVRIPPMHTLEQRDGFSDIVDCFNRLAEELSGTETLRTDFMANVSHELKTPLSVIQNYATMLQQPGLSEEQRLEYARAIRDTSRRLASLITNILKLNKLENQQIFPLRQTYDLGEQLCECLLAFEDLWESKALDIHTEIAQDVLVEGDAELLSLVWNNLFSNAIKFTDVGGRISVTLTVQGDMAVVAVADTGCGFGSEVGRHIFEKFYQGDTSRATQGNGLGLALVKRVVDILGGDITVASEAGKGSVFTVSIRRRLDGKG